MKIRVKLHTRYPQDIAELTRICSLVCEEFSNHGSVQRSRGVVEDHGLRLLHCQHPEHGIPAGEREVRFIILLSIYSSPGRLATTVVAPGGEGL